MKINEDFLDNMPADHTVDKQSVVDDQELREHPENAGVFTHRFIIIDPFSRSVNTNEKIYERF